MHYLSLLVFFDKGFGFQSAFCNGCHDVLKVSIDINSIAILNIHDIYYLCIINWNSKKRSHKFFKKNANSSEKSGS